MGDIRIQPEVAMGKVVKPEPTVHPSQQPFVSRDTYASQPLILNIHHDRPLLFPHLQPNVHRTARLLPRPTGQIRPLSFPRRSLLARPRRFFPLGVGGDHDGILLHVTPEQAVGRVSEVAVERVYILDGFDQFGDHDQPVSFEWTL
jgi:hypothetical protein